MSIQRILQVVTRGDDAASSLSANRGIREACEHGVLRNVSVMVPGPYLEDAWKQLGHLQGTGPGTVAFGLHVCLNSEWDYPRWGPISAADRVPSLVVEDGCFPQSTKALHSQAVLDQMLIEVQAQLDAMRAVGFRPVYVDEHMGVGWVQGLDHELALLAMRENLVYSPKLTNVSFSSAGRDDNGQKDYATHFLNILREEAMTPAYPTESATLLVVGHPAFDDEEMRGIRSHGVPGAVARDRVGQRILFQRSDVREYFTHAARAIRYDEV